MSADCVCSVLAGGYPNRTIYWPEPSGEGQYWMWDANDIKPPIPACSACVAIAPPSDAAVGTTVAEPQGNPNRTIYWPEPSGDGRYWMRECRKYLCELCNLCG